MSRYIDADKLWNNRPQIPRGKEGEWVQGFEYCRHSFSKQIRTQIDNPTADVVEVRHDFNVGDFCLYGFTDGNNSLAIVEIVKILDDERGIAEVRFHKVIRDNTGNGFFHYLFKKGGTMNASFKYLKNITPKN